MISTATSEPTPAPHSSPPADEWDWEVLLRRVALAAGLDAAPEAVADAARCTASNEQIGWPDRLIRACEEIGLRARRLEGTVSGASAAVGPDHPVVALGADGHWLLVVDRRGRSLLVDGPGLSQPVWTSRGDVAARLDPSAMGAVEWVAVDPPGMFAAGAIAPGTNDASSPSAPGTLSPFARLRALLRQERHDVAVVLVYAIGVGVLTLATPIAVQALVNTVAFGTLLQPLAVLALLLLAGLAFAAVLRALQAWVVEVLQRRLFLRLVGDLAHRLPRVRLDAFDQAHGPELLNRFFDLFTLQKAVASLLLGGLELVLAALVGMLVLAFYHPLLLAFDVILLMLVAVILFVLGRNATRTAVIESKRKYEVAGWLEEVARHPMAFKLAGGPRLAREMTDRLATSYLAARRDHWRVVFRQLIAALALQAFASAGVLGIGGWLVIERQLTLGQLVAAELIVTMVVASLAKMGKHLETTYDLLAALDKLGQLVDLPLERSGRTAAMPEPSPKGARLDGRGLAFAHPGGESVFDDLDVRLDAGDRVVLTGVSGSGRTALVDVLVGLREPSAGRVEVDGIDIGDLRRATLRERVAVVRGPEIVVGTIFDNIAFGRPELDPVAVRDALRAVDLLDDVAALPDGLATRLNATGTPLSTGQATRLTIARALVGQPALLVIDRALDGLDPRTRTHVLSTIFAPDAPWTLLVVSDDPAVARRGSRVLALSEGTLEERPS